MSTYELLLAIHIICAVAWVGGGLTIYLFGRMAAATGDRQKMHDFSLQAGRIGKRLYAPLSIVLLVAGILLVEEVDYDHTAKWVLVGYAGWIVSFVIGAGYYTNAEKRQAAVVADKGVDSPEFLALYRQVATVSAIECAILFLVVADMAIKPGS